jgi:hypothetical protein
VLFRSGRGPEEDRPSGDEKEKKEDDFEGSDMLSIIL